MTKRVLFGIGIVALGALLFIAGLLMSPSLRTLPTTASAAASIGGPFKLVDGDGKTVTDQSLRGRWTMIYFGYTRCPDACPTALQDMANALDILPPDAAKRVSVVFITVDPERDTPAVVKDYVASFGAGFIALSGSQDEIGKAERGYRVYAAKHPEKDGGYSMDHSSIIYVMNPDGEFVTNFTHETSPQQIADKLKQLGA